MFQVHIKRRAVRQVPQPRHAGRHHVGHASELVGPARLLAGHVAQLEPMDDVGLLPALDADLVELRLRDDLDLGVPDRYVFKKVKQFCRC